MISLVIPVFNRPKEFKKCLESVFRQTYRDFEVIIVDDGSVEDVESVVRQFEIKKYIKQTNSGAPTARNRGFEEAKGEFVLFLDADVIMQPNMLDKMYKALVEHSEVSYVYSGFKMGWKKFSCVKFDVEKLRQNNFISTMALIRTKDFIGFDKSLKRFQDWDLWLSLLEQGKIGFGVNEILFKSIASGGMSFWLPKVFYKLFSKSVRVLEYEKARQIVLKKHGLT